MNNNFLKFGLDKNIQLPKLQLILYQNKQHAIGKLQHYYNVNHKMTLGEVNTLSLTIPQYININNEQTINPMFDKFKYRYFIKLKFNRYEEWYHIKNIRNKSSDRSKTIELESTNSMLKDIDLYNYDVTSFTIEEICNGNILKSKDGILKNTTWSLGNIDESLKTKKRGIELNGQSNLLDAVFQIAKKFNSVIEFDTINETINFYDEESYGKDNGLVFQYNRYLQSLEEEHNSDELCTILKVKGKDGISINSISPTGQGYLMDYSYFIYPFERDKNRKVLTHSDYFEDDLCHALLDYDQIINDNKGKLSELIKKRSLFDESLTIKEMHLSDLKGELEGIESVLSIAQSNGRSTHKIIKNRNKKRKQVKEKENQINFINNQLKKIDVEINSLKFTLSEERNFTNSQLESLKNYKITRTYENNNITNTKELIMAAQEDFRKLRMPKQIIKLNIIDFFNFIEAQRDWDKLRVGDVITINYHRFNLDKVKARINNITIDYSNKDIQVDITTLSYTDANKEISKILYNASSVSSIISDTRYDVDNMKDQLTELEKLIKDASDAVKKPITASEDKTMSIDHVGVTSWEKDNPKHGVRINNGSFQITNNGEDHFNNYIDGDGIHANFLTGKIDKNKVQIDVDSIDGLDDFVQNKNDKIIEELWESANKQYAIVDEMEEVFNSKIGILINDMDDIGIELDGVADDMVGRIDKVAGDLNVYQGVTDNAIQERVKSKDFASYREMTDNHIAQVVKDNNHNLSLINQSAISISTLVKDNNENKSVIEQHSDSIKTLVTNGKGMATSIQQTADSLKLLAKNTNDNYAALNVRAEGIEQIVVNNEKNLKAYKVHTDKLIGEKVSNNEYESYIIHTADTISDMVRGINGNSSQIAINSKAIAMKVGNDEFNSQVDILKNQIRSTVSQGDVKSIIKQSATEVEYAFNDINPYAAKFTRNGLELGAGCSISCDCIKASSSNPIIKLFKDCSIDATYNNEEGSGDAIRLKKDRRSYVFVSSSMIAFYLNGIIQFQIAPASADGGGRCLPNFTFLNDMTVLGDKKCVQKTENYGMRSYYAYEDCESWLTDRHRDKLTKDDKREDGLYEKTIVIDDIFRESVNLEMEYNVGIYKYGRGDIWSEDLTSTSFKIVAEKPIEFTYIIEAKRQGCEHKRNEQYLG